LDSGPLTGSGENLNGITHWKTPLRGSAGCGKNQMWDLFFSNFPMLPTLQHWKNVMVHSKLKRRKECSSKSTELLNKVGWEIEPPNLPYANFSEWEATTSFDRNRAFANENQKYFRR